jgi:hypothetical protein
VVIDASPCIDNYRYSVMLVVRRNIELVKEDYSSELVSNVTPERKLIDHGDGAWRVGDYWIMGPDMRSGLTISCQAEDGTDVTFAFSPDDCIAILGLMSDHQSELLEGADGARQHSPQASASGVTLHRNQPMPIPVNPHEVRVAPSDDPIHKY